ncbi:MAG: 50S ribosomal protein L11 methyltransferase [Anaerolineae bacterium]|jgi:ribosomal protein L11 methyltransferase
MEWLEVSVEVENEAVEAVAEVLSRYAHRGVVVEAGPDGWNAGPVVVRAYLPTDDELWAKKNRIQEGLWHLGQIQPLPEPSFRPVAEEDWTQAWKKRLKVLRIGEHIVIQPSWLDYRREPGDIVIQLDPGMAFGTGLHPTTQMCLSALEEHVQSGMEVLDLGTGSGILAIAAARLKAKHVLAVDHDKQAARVAYTNVVANRVQETVTVRQGSLQDVSGRYDLVVVNILARVIVEMVQQGLSERVRPDGVVITAGITVEQVPDVVEACERGGLELVDRKQSGDWVSLLAKRT